MIGKIQLYNNWGFVYVDHDTGRYYRKLFLRTFGVKLERPSNTEHITIISPWDYIDLSSLHGYNGLEINFDTIPLLFHNDSAVWIDVVSQDINDFRISLGLDESPMLGLHFCIGYIHTQQETQCTL